MISDAEKIADNLTKEDLLKCMASYVRAEAKRRKLPESSIVDHIFANGSVVSGVLWSKYINDEQPKE